MADLQQILQDPNYVNANAETKAAIFEKHAPTDPNYVQANPETQAAIRTKFGVTPGGAAVGGMPSPRRNPMAGPVSTGEALSDIGLAGVGGTVAGYAAPEILQAAGGALRQIPYPIAQTAGGVIANTGQALRGMRGQSAVSGGASGLVSESAGQIADVAAPNSRLIQEGTRLVGGGMTAETLNLGKMALQKYLVTPSLGLVSKIKKELGRSALEKLETSPQTLSEQERAFVEEQIAALRGPAGKTNEPLEQVGSIMGRRGQELLDQSEQQMIAAVQQRQGVGRASPVQRELSDVGTELQGTINTRHKTALDARRAEYAANEKTRNTVVSQREGAGQTIDTLPEYQSLVADLKSQTKPGVHATDVADDFQHILNQITVKSKKTEQPFGGMGADPFAVEPKTPPSFQQLDEVRRQLGEVFRGRAPEGYKAIDADTARTYYAKISDLQKKYAGEAQSKLLDDYAERTQGLEMFSSKYGKKATALDQYREDKFSNDPKTLPPTYFNSKTSVKALKELTGNSQQVNDAALHYADKQLENATASDVRAWMNKNSDWLPEVPVANRVIAKYAERLEAAESSISRATTFATQANKDAKLLIDKMMPAKLATDIIKSGDSELWAKVAPAIVQSPQAKQQMVQSVRQVIADEANSAGTINLFEKSIRPALEKTGIATKQEMDFIAQRLNAIQEMNIPDKDKIGHIKTLLLGSAAGWAAGLTGRAAVGGYDSITSQIPPTTRPSFELR